MGIIKFDRPSVDISFRKESRHPIKLLFVPRSNYQAIAGHSNLTALDI
jgi:hypothetical protein